MPPRWLCVLIVAAWLTLTGWLFYDELLPRLLPGQPPPVTIDLVEEAQSQTRRLPLTWAVYQDDRKECDAHARLEHPERGEYVMTTEFLLGELAKGSKPRPSLEVGTLEVLALSSVYRVSPEGDLLGFENRLTARPRVLSDAFEGRLDAAAGRFHLATLGEVRGGRLEMTRRWSVDGEVRSVSPFYETRIARGAAVVLPLNPPKRIRGVRPGQSWQALVVDPFAWATDPTWARARVRPEPEPLRWERPGGRLRAGTDVPCLVIDYEGDQVKVSTWVGEEDGNVLKQEATFGRTQWAMFRQ